MTNPLLEEPELPRFSALRPEHVLPAVQELIARQREAVAALVASDAPRTWDTVLAPQEDMDDRLARAWAPVTHLESVRDEPALREAHNEALTLISEHHAELGQNRALYEAVRQVAERSDFGFLTPAQRKIVDDALRDFRLSGVALEGPQRQRFKEIVSELSRLGSEFEQVVLDATDAWFLELEDESRLAGIPASGLAILRQAARDAGADGYRVTLHQPSYLAVMTHADERGLRAEVYRAFHTRASDQGPLAGRYDNGARLERIMALRHEAARLLGYANAAEVSLATKMAAKPERVFGFLRELAGRVRPVAERELSDLRLFAQTTLGIEELHPWDVPYAAEKLRQHRFALSDEELRPYFPLDAALSGLFHVAERAFGVKLRERKGVDTWHPDVRYYELLDDSGAPFAGIYFDLYARGAKRGGAWVEGCQARRRHAAGLQQPIAFLTCNFAAPTDELPSLLSHEDVLTLFHEFGHGLHYLLTEVDYPSIAGTHGVEWDAVELPSQFMENYCWEQTALELIARHYQTGAPLPEDLFRRLLATRDFHAGLHLARQLEFALFDFRLHHDYDPGRGARPLELLEEVRREVAVLPMPSWHRMPWSFGHIFGGGYDAGYYSYLWAEVLSADAFERFREAGIFDRDTGRSFRREVLATGGSRPALVSFIAFRGREPDPAALLRSYGLAA